MKLLDKLRNSPDWQSEDPAVRASAVRGLPPDEEEVLAQIAQQDDDPGVRRAAVGRIGDLDVLIQIVARETDESVKQEAVNAVRHLAIEAVDPSIGGRALQALTDERNLVAVARSARLESISRSALERLADGRALATVASRANRLEIAKSALDRLTHPDELRSVVLRTDDRVIAVAAFDRLADVGLGREDLELIAKRAKHKTVTRRARAAVAALDEALGTSPPATRHPQLCERLESLTDTDDLSAGRVALEDIVRQWTEEDAAPAPFADRFATARRRVEDRLVQLETELLARQKTVAREEAAVTARTELCEQVERLDEPEMADRLEAARAAWAQLAPLPTAVADEATELKRRFEQALAAGETRRARWTAMMTRLNDLETLVAGMEQLSGVSDADWQKRWLALDKTWRDVAAELPVQDRHPAVATRLGALEERRAALNSKERAAEKEAKDALTKAAHENLASLTTRCDLVERMVASETLRLRTAEHQLRSLRETIEHVGPLPTRRDRDAVTRRLRHAHTALLGRVRELRDFADWQRWANLGLQEDLCRQMEGLGTVEDGETLVSRFRELMSRWRQVADVPKGQGEALWQRFKTAHDAVAPRYQAAVKEQSAERERNLQRRQALVEEAEQLATSTDWLKTVQRITELQAAWKTLGPGPRKAQQELWNRFRAACHTFFTRRKADLAERKKVWAENLTRKEALCAKVEALAEVEPVAEAIQQTRSAQTEWKTIGPVRRSRSEAVWQRFQTACQAVFDRAHTAEREAVAEVLAVREALCAELEALVPDNGSTTPTPELAATVRDLQRRWRSAPEVPPALRRRLGVRFGQGLSRLAAAYPDVFRGTELDPVRQLRRLEQLCERVETLADDLTGDQSDASPAEILATKWRDALASNLMGVRVDEAAKRRAAVAEVRRLQTERRRLGSLPGEKGQQLAARFQEAADRVLGNRRRSPIPHENPSATAAQSVG